MGTWLRLPNSPNQISPSTALGAAEELGEKCDLPTGVEKVHPPVIRVSKCLPHSHPEVLERPLLATPKRYLPPFTHTQSVSTSSSQTEVISLHPVEGESSPLEHKLCDASGMLSGSILHPQCPESA